MRRSHGSRSFGWVLAILLVMVTVRPIIAQEASLQERSDQLEIEHDLSTAFETPHTKWAKPYAGGTVRVLFVTSQFQGSTYTREIIELMQRFDLDAEAAYYRTQSKRLLGDGNPRWYDDPEAGTKRALRLLGTPFDAFFLNRVGLADLPDAVREIIVERVNQGAGLVLIEPEPAPRPDTWKKLAPYPDFLPAGECFTVGRGRAVVLSAPEKLAYDVGWETKVDYRMERQGRVLLWAANRAPTARLDVQMAGSQAASVQWQKATPGSTLQIRRRRGDGQTVVLHDGSCRSAAGSVRVDLPVLRAGAYHLDAILTGKDGVEAWDTVAFEMTTERGVAAVRLDSSWGEVGGTLRGKVVLSGDVATGDRVNVRLVDRRGRVLVRKRLGTMAGSDAPFEFVIERWMPMLLRVEAIRFDGERDVASAYTDFRVTRRRQGEYNFTVWNYPGGDLAPYGVESMARNGVTTILQGGPPPTMLSAYELPFVPYATSIRPDSHSVTGMLDPDGVLKGGCLNEPARGVMRVNEDVERQRDARGHGVLAYSLGDENAVRASCLSPGCLVAYRKYLRTEYGDIAALNAEWETAFASFDDITLSQRDAVPAESVPAWFKTYYAERHEKNLTDSHKLTPQQIADGDRNNEVWALQAGNFARWYDRQMFQCYNVVQLCKRYAEAFKKIDPKALTGFEGTDSFSIRRHTTRSRQGGDIDLFIRDLEYFGPYPGPGNELVRSIAPRDFPCGNWIGYAKDADTLLRKYWDQITNGMNMVQWWRWDCLEEFHGFLSPNFSPFPATIEMLEDTQVVRDGLGTLLMKSDMQDDGVAMLYSLPSTYIAHFDAYRRHGNLKQVHRAWFKMIHDAGLQFRYVTDRMLRLGEFDTRRYKVLILPQALAIGAAEADVIREFVRGGGTVIADVRPGMYDGHCKRRAVGALDDVFGIERTGDTDPVLVDRMVVSGEIADQKLDMRWGNWHGKEIYPQMNADPAIKETTGKALGKTFYYHFWNVGAPQCIVNEFGSGRAVLLNFGVVDAPAATLVNDLLASAGVRPTIQVDKLDTANPETVEITRWHNGDLEIISLFGADTGEVRVSLPSERHVYDLKRHADLGRVNRFSTRLRAHRASFYVLMPGAAPEIAVTLDQDRVTAGTNAKANLSIQNIAGIHALRVRINDPTGSQVDWLDRVVLVTNGRAEIDIPFAFNDPAGTWTVRATDLYTNRTVTAQVTIE